MSEFQDLPQGSGVSPDSGSDQTENNGNNQQCALGRLHASVRERCVPLELVITGDKGGSQLSHLSCLSRN